LQLEPEAEVLPKSGDHDQYWPSLNLKMHQEEEAIADLIEQ
jgi:hypothetical protein